jgi:hypothetical protein
MAANRTVIVDRDALETAFKCVNWVRDPKTA